MAKTKPLLAAFYFFIQPDMRKRSRPRDQTALQANHATYRPEVKTECVASEPHFKIFFDKRDILFFKNNFS